MEIKTWRQHSANIIWNIVFNAQKQGKSNKEIKNMVKDAYPYGARENHPYKAWLLAQKEIFKKTGVIS